MRKNLKDILNKRMSFEAEVERFGSKTNYHGFPTPTILLKNLKSVEKEGILSDHIWLTVGKTIENAGLKEGDKIIFDGRVKTYIKGYVNWREGIDERTKDYKISHVTKIKKL